MSDTYKVKKKDTLLKISRKILEKKLGRKPTEKEAKDFAGKMKKLNKLTGSELKIGQVLKLPKSTTTAGSKAKDLALLDKLAKIQDILVKEEAAFKHLKEHLDEKAKKELDELEKRKAKVLFKKIGKIIKELEDTEKVNDDASLRDDDCGELERSIVSKPATTNRYKKGRDGEKIKKIVLHTSEGSGKSLINTFQNPNGPKSSAHYGVLEDGTIVRFVADEDTAWHVRGHNSDSLGIEMAGFYNKDLNDAQIKAVQRLLRCLMAKYNLKKSDIKTHQELDPARRKDPGKKNFERMMAGL